MASITTDFGVSGPSAASPARVPMLQNGDRLTREEFERRYEAQPELKKAELLEGVVYMPLPVSQRYHGAPHFNFISWLGSYAMATPGVRGGDNASLKLDMDNEPQPDCLLYVEPACGGRVRLDEKGYIVAAPDLLGEIAASSVSYDLHVKKHVYRRSGVKEYVVWRVQDAAIDWFILRHGEYHGLAAVDGVYKSETFPGLWLNAPAMLADDIPRVLETLQRGLNSPEHQAFVEHLARKKQEAS